MSPFPTPIQLASGHHRQGKLEGNFHIKDEGLAGFKLSQVVKRKTGIHRPGSFLLLGSDKFIFNSRKKKKHPESHFFFQPGTVISSSSAWLGGMVVDHKACELVNRIKVALLRDVGLKNRP